MWSVLSLDKKSLSYIKHSDFPEYQDGFIHANCPQIRASFPELLCSFTCYHSALNLLFCTLCAVLWCFPHCEKYIHGSYEKIISFSNDYK